MLLDISDILKNPGGQMSFKGEISLKEQDFSRLGVSFEKPLEVEGQVKNTGGVLVLEANARGGYETRCDRCGDAISKEIEFFCTEDYVKSSGIVNDGDAIQLEGHTINLDDVISDNAFAAIPLKNLCKEDCKGVCQMCGQNLNLKQCDCTDDNWDPRFDCLKGLFD